MICILHILDLPHASPEGGDKKKEQNNLSRIAQDRQGRGQQSFSRFGHNTQALDNIGSRLQKKMYALLHKESRAPRVLSSPRCAKLERGRRHESGRWRSQRDESSGDGGCLHDADLAGQEADRLVIEEREGERRSAA